MSREPRKLTPEQIKDAALPLTASLGMTIPAVYALLDLRCGTIGYVGRTKNIYKRFEAYRCPKPQSKNRRLSQWLVENRNHIGFVVLHDSNCPEQERAWIARYRTTIFNLMGGDPAGWDHSPKPWAAGTGVRCPSEYLLHQLHARKRTSRAAEIREFRGRMSEPNRCLFELETLQWIEENQPFGYQAKERWLRVTTPKMLKVLEHAAA